MPSRTSSENLTYDDPGKGQYGHRLPDRLRHVATGFDAPIEQVMYIDKRVKNHNLLQTIARVNRVVQGQDPWLHRGLHRADGPPAGSPVDLRR